MVWCPMITAQYVIVQRVVGRPLDAATRAAIIRHFERTRTGEGAWGLHPESPGFVFVTALGYVALRLLGVAPEAPSGGGGPAWLRAQPGGVPAIPTWGKFWLALIGLYDYRGLNACPPELFLAPAWLPVHPRRYYCHTRSIYLAMAYLYGRRARGALGPITEALRHELYAEPFERIDFAAHRDSVAPTDRCIMPSALLRVAFAALNAHERIHSRRWRRRALDHCFARILFEQKASRYQGLSPVNALLNCLAIWATDPAHPELDPSLAGLEAWKWQDEDAGRRYAGARSQTWDTAFAVHALRALPECSGAAAAALRRAHGFLRDGQLTSELPGFREEYRDPSLGGWCFSDGRHRWPVSDCTAEALSAVLAIHEAPGVLAPTERMEEERLGQAVVFLLSRQNRDGGFATYERRRGGPLLERLNPSEMFTRCMTEQSYVECTGSAIAALAHVRAAHPRLHRAAVDRAIARGVLFLRCCPAIRRRVSGLLGHQLHLRDLPRGARAPGMRGARGRSGPDPSRPMADRRAARRRGLGRALLGLSRGPLRRARGEPGGHDRLGALGPHGHRRSPIGGRRSRARVAPAEAAAGWLLAPAGGQRRVLRVGDAGLPPVQELLPGLGVVAGRGPDAHRL